MLRLTTDIQYAFWVCCTNDIPLSFILLWSHWGSVTIPSLSHLSTHLWPIYSVPFWESQGILPGRHGRQAVVPNYPPLSANPTVSSVPLPPFFSATPFLLPSGWNWLSRGKERQAEVMNLQCWGLPLWPCCLEDLACPRGSPGHRQGNPQMRAVFVLGFKTLSSFTSHFYADKCCTWWHVLDDLHLAAFYM